MSYVYELREGGQVVATGRLMREQPFDVGERIELNDRVGTVRSVESTLDPHERRLVIELLPDPN